MRPALLLTLLLTVITGVMYPALMTGIAQLIFPFQANGSLVEVRGTAYGSTLIGQPFSDPRYFWSRPSATSPMPYNAAASSGSNVGPTNPALIDTVKARIQKLREADPQNNLPIPVDLVTSSASGLDPHISIAAARYQASRIARLRNLPMDNILSLINQYTEYRSFGVLGEPGVNVLKLNMALDHLL
jgi:K+-transporting ATPase ATPase C chain